MAILENATDYANGGQVTAANLNALTESARFVRGGTGIENSTNTTDEATLDVNNAGELIIATADGVKGINTAQINDSQITAAKIATDAVTLAKIQDGAVSNAKLSPTAGSAAVTGSGTGATGTNVIEANSIGAGDLNNDIISGQTDLTATPDVTLDSILVSDNGTLKELLLKYLPLPKAYGIVDMDSGSRTTVTGDYGVSSVSGDANTRRVNLSNAMSSATDYVVQLTHEEESISGPNDYTTPVVEIIDASTFDIHIGEDPNLRIHFTVFGDLA